VQGVGVVSWQHRCRAGKVNALIPVLKMGRRKMALATFGACALVRVEGLSDRYVLPACRWAVE
jgi:hypothetical protein